MELFNEKGCLTNSGLLALVQNRLDEMGRLEAAEHLSYCDKCLDRYTGLLTPEVIEQPKHSVSGPVLRSVWAQAMQSTFGRSAVAVVAAALALTFWSTGTFQVQKWQKAQLPTQNSLTGSAITQMWDHCTDFISNSLKLPELSASNGGNNHE
ncbi:MAG: hypothetical protein LKJ90_06990 [Faecalibacterium sp.]|jgi:hypothetical protein|nr:hypothetical protein [Faecalibacterium sp.]